MNVKEFLKPNRKKAGLGLIIMLAVSFLPLFSCFSVSYAQGVTGPALTCRFSVICDSGLCISALMQLTYSLFEFAPGSTALLLGLSAIIFAIISSYLASCAIISVYDRVKK